MKMLASFVLYNRKLSELAMFMYKACKGGEAFLPDADEKQKMFDKWVIKSFPAMTVPVFEDEGELHVASDDGNGDRYCEVMNAIVAGLLNDL